MAHSNPSGLFIEFTPTSAVIAFGDDVTRVELAHEAGGGLTPAGRSTLKDAVAATLGARHPASVRCAIGIRGVSLRKLKVPPSKPDALRQLLALQIEREFPLGPDRLAWGYRKIGGATDIGPQEVLLVAVKREFVEDYAAVLAECGLQAVFTVGLLAVAADVGRTTAESFALVNTGSAQTEIVLCENGMPTAIRTLPAATADDAMKLVERLEHSPPLRRVLLVGDPVRDVDRARSLKGLLGADVECELLFNGAMPAGSPAIAAFQNLTSESDAGRLITLETGDPALAETNTRRPLPRKWIGIAAALVFALLALRYVGPVLGKPALAGKIARAREAQAALPPIQEELEFLRHLESSRPPYLDAVTILGDAAPRGSRLEDLTLDRRGGFSLRITLQNPAQATELRTKLLESGMFSNVMLEEQTPGGNNRKMLTRISARWKTDPKTPSKLIEKIVAEAAAQNTNNPAAGNPGQPHAPHH